MCVGGNALPEKILHVFVFSSILSSYFHSIQHTGVCSVIEYSLAVWRLGGDEETNTSTTLNTEQCLDTAAAPYLYEMSELVKLAKRDLAMHYQYLFAKHLTLITLASEPAFATFANSISFSTRSSNRSFFVAIYTC